MKYLCLLLAVAAVCSAVAPRQQAPGFSALAVLPDNSFATLKLSDFRDKYVVLLFYPFDFTYVCPTEIISYSERANDFRGNSPPTQPSAQRSSQSQSTPTSPIWPGRTPRLKKAVSVKWVIRSWPTSSMKSAKPMMLSSPMRALPSVAHF